MAKKKHDMKEPYTDWLSSPDAVGKLKKLIERVGFPLEITTRNKLRNLGYNVSNSYYSELDNKSGQESSREIDIYAKRTIDRIKYKGCEFFFELAIVGECSTPLLTISLGSQMTFSR